mgnify:CR=1 FL=1
MILLISVCSPRFSLPGPHLNSTVILLILKGIIDFIAGVFTFKFHCDSINMQLRRFHWRRICEFKFHCDSINIEFSKHFFISLVHLNSTVILLIWSTQSISLFYRRRFKFHCDSINICAGNSYNWCWKNLNSTVILLIL